MISALLWLALAGCAPGPVDQGDPVAAPDAHPRPSSPLVSDPMPQGVALAVPAEDGDAADVAFEWFGVGERYQGFFKDKSAVAALGQALAPCLGQTAYLRVSFDAAEHLGRIVARVEPGAGDCAPERVGAEWDLAKVVPIARALAAYRDALSGSYDIRLASFQVGATFRGGGDVCTVFAGGTFPADGGAFLPCVEHRGGQTCLPSLDDGVVRWQVAEADERAAAACFGAR